MLYYGFEHNMCATMRYTFKGEKEIVAIPFFDVFDYFAGALLQTWDKTKEKFVNFVARALRSLTVTDISQMEANDVVIYRAFVRSGSVVYIPAGFVMCERMVGNAESFGFRFQVMDSEPEANDGLRQIQGVLKDAKQDDSFQGSILQVLLAEVREPTILDQFGQVGMTRNLSANLHNAWKYNA